MYKCQVIEHRSLLQWQEPQEVEVQMGSLPGDVMHVPLEARLKMGLAESI